MGQWRVLGPWEASAAVALRTIRSTTMQLPSQLLYFASHFVRTCRGETLPQIYARVRTSTPIPLLCVVLVTACGSSPSNRPPPPPHLSLVQELAYSDASDLITFRSLPALPVSESGQLYVPIDNRTRVAVIDSLGHIVDTIGRRGEGPGEFMRIASLELSALGELWVFDNQLQRVTRFDADHEMLEARLVSFVSGVGIDGSGAGLVTVTESFGPWDDPSFGPPGSASREDREQARRWIVEYRHGVNSFDTLATIPAADYRFRVPAGSGNTLSGRQPWASAPRLARRADGRGILVATPRDAGWVQLSRFGVDGLEPSTTVEAQLPTARITSEVVDQWISAFIGDLRRARVDRSELRSVLVVPEEFPGVGSEILAFGEEVWAALGRTWDRSEWALIDGTGQVLGVVNLPHGSRIVAARGDRLWVVTPGTLDLPLITRYRVDFNK